MPSLKKLYCIDPWEDYDDYGWNRNYDNDYSPTSENVKEKFDLATKDHVDRICVIRKFSTYAYFDVEDGSLDFCFIDGNHKYEYVKEDIKLWAPKVRVGGILSGHDFSSGKSGVPRAVKENFGKDFNLISGTSIWWRKIK